MTSLTNTELRELWVRNAQVPNTIYTTVQELIAQRAGAQSDRPAITAWDGECTYGQLIYLTSRLASYLSHNVCPKHGKVLPILMSKSKWTPIAMVGALLGGWGIALLDIQTPAARLAEILNMLDPPCVLTILETTTAVHNVAPVPMLRVDALGLEDKSLSGSWQPVESKPAKTAAVVFTSGSTGSPKGVMLGPECISTAAVYGSEILQLGPSSRLFQFSSFSFDVSLHEVFMTLVAGGCLCIPSETERLNNPIEAIKATQANFICTTPSVIMSMLAEDIASTPIEVIVLTGEALTSRIRPLLDMRFCLFDWYGASECPIVSLAPLIKESWVPSQLGSRHPGNCWVVRSEDSDVLCGFGEVGELLVESSMLTLGYLNAPQQAEAKFAVDPSWLTDGHSCVTGRRGRLYRTGDLVRNNRDWTLDHIGRKDLMIKIRGQRVELSETEFHIWYYLRSEDLPLPVRVLDVLVELMNFSQDREDENICCFLYVDRQLDLLQKKHIAKSASMPCISIYAPDPLLQDLQSGLDRSLRAALPACMVPSLYFQLLELPVSPSGKVDRKLLRALASRISHSDLLSCRVLPQQSLALPRNDTELALRRLWAEILDVEATTIHANMGFLHCGGDSIRAIRLSWALLEEFNFPTKVSELLRRETTIQNLATQLEQHKFGRTVGEPHMDIAAVLKAWEARLRKLPISLLTTHSFRNQCSRVLLTGATGYIGTHILRELLSSHFVSKVIVLVRAADIDTAKERVRDVAITAGWWQESEFCRIEVWLGNLTEPRLGLREEKLAELSKIDIIIHNGAVVNYVASYDVLERANVLSAFYLLEAALQSRHLRTFIFVSGGIKQDQDQSEAEYLATLNKSEGYSQTKYVSEQLTMNAGKLYNEAVQSHSAYEDQPKLATGSRAFVVIKPGYVIGDQVTGLSNTDDFIWRLVAGAVRMGSFPCDPPDYWLDIAEVTYVARHTANWAQLGAPTASSGLIAPPCPSLDDARGNEAMSFSVIFDEINRGLPMHRFWHAIQSQAQLSLKQMDWDSWLNHASVELERDKETHPLWGIQLFLGPSLGNRIRTEDHLVRSTAESIASHEVEAAVRRCVEYLCDIHFIVPASKEVVLDSSHLENEAGGCFENGRENATEGGKARNKEGERHHPIIRRSKLTYWS